MQSNIIKDVAPAHTHIEESVHSIAFSPRKELLWAGAESGALYAMALPPLRPYSSVRAHTLSLADLAPLGEGVVSVSANALRYHASGGRELVALVDPPGLEGELVAVEADPQAPACALVGCAGAVNPGATALPPAGAMACVDVDAKKVVGFGNLGDAAVLLRAPAGRGLVAVGTAGGGVLLVDPRAGFAVEAALSAHAAGLAALDARGDLLATAGFGMRQGAVVADTYVKVFDLRATPRLLSSLPFGAGPSMLRFHPKFSATLLIAGTQGVFVLADASGASYNRTYQVETGADALLAADVSASGEVIAFGSAGGMVHTWAFAQAPRVNAYARPPDTPLQPQRPPPRIGESEPWGAAPFFPCMQGRPLSDWDDEKPAPMPPPRVVDPALRQFMRLVDFVGYVQNPKHRRGLPPGEAARLAAPLRNARLQPRKAGPVLPKAEVRLANAAQQGGHAGDGLPAMYRRARAKPALWGARFADAGPEALNGTRFAGLEGEIANGYANSLLQVLYFMPAMRAAFLGAVPDPDAPYSLADELGLLFRMLAAGGPAACRAANLLRALRQNRQAAALGLLETHKQRSGQGSDIEVETTKDRSLARRCQSLQRFLLEQLHRELAQRTRPAVNPEPRSGPVPGSDAATVVRQLFQLAVHQRTRFLAGAHRQKPWQIKEAVSYQTELQYPPARLRPPPPPPAPPEQPRAQSFRPGAVLPPLPPTPLLRFAAGAPRPSFAELLSASLSQEDELRAWISETLGYQQVRRARLPVALPQARAAESGAHQDERPWLPLALEVAADATAWAVRVRGAESAAELASESSGAGASAGVRAVYELTAVVAHVAGSTVGAGEADAREAEGHLVAHIRVLPPYRDPERGILPPLAVPPSPGQSPMTFPGRPARARAPQAAVDVTEFWPEPGGKEASAEPGAAIVAAFPADARPTALQTAGDGAVLAGAVHAVDAALDPDKGAASSKPVGPDHWLLFNDEAVSASSADEARALYDGRVAPCLLYFTQVPVLEDCAMRLGAEPAPAPVLSWAAFRSLCAAPPLQASSLAFAPRTFEPLGPGEAPAPGTLLALDAEFVAHSPPDTVLRGGVEVEVCPARLGLARVSVVRGAGERAGEPCIDDYIQAVEPVHDYLTKWSGLVAGDLDPALSRRHLTTLKRAYLKLRYLVDAGCVLVGHGLKTDLRMLNIAVPPEQLRDTCDLFCFKRQRRLSLRFLASYLLGLDIQAATHDSIEDARTALELFRLYERLAADGSLQARLLEMYRWGKAHGWNAVALKDGVPQPPVRPT
ncbi:hypothetical protein WJX81_005692 [Elliptochloris bilobata]|uniref:USP domain-containing protein n=1 Tax=Elliptochloris bilobata TaxID=381761 RepID=A0AAW1SD41_9CHLO